MPLTTTAKTTTGKLHLPDLAYASYIVDRPGKIVFVGHHLKTDASTRCLVRRISLDGALLEVSPHLEVPTNFFLEILGIRDEIGCTLIMREGEKVQIGFNMLIDAEFMHHVLRLGFETSH